MATNDAKDAKADETKFKVEYKNLGRSGIKVSNLSFGAWTTWGVTVSDDEAFDCMKAAWDLGCNFFDNAEGYGNGKAEVTMGKCIKRLNVDRSQLVISTKIFWGRPEIPPGGENQRDVCNQLGLSRKHIIEGIQKSLARLQLSYVDLVFCHRPDPETPIEETVRAMNFIIDKGWAFYWGTSEWSADQISDACNIAKQLGLVGPVFEQPQYSMLHRTRFEVEYARLYKEFGIGTTIWSALASGLLTGKYTSQAFPKDSRLSAENLKWMKDQLLAGSGMNGLEEKSFESILNKVSLLQPIATELGCTLPQLAIAWCLVNPNVTTVITGASKVTQVKENWKSLEVVPKLTPVVLEKIEAILQNKPKPPKSWR